MFLSISPENRFSDDIKGYRKRALAWNGLVFTHFQWVSALHIQDCWDKIWKHDLITESQKNMITNNSSYYIFDNFCYLSLVYVYEKKQKISNFKNLAWDNVFRVQSLVNRIFPILYKTINPHFFYKSFQMNSLKDSR